METKFIEATNGPRNWGKFCVARFQDAEWSRPSAISKSAFGLVHQRGWTSKHLLVIDLETGEGAIFRMGGCAKADLEKHRIWVCPLFEPFLAWLYQQHVRELAKLPDHVDLPDAEFSMQGYRRPGPKEARK